MWARLRRLRELSIREWRELLLSCAWQLRLRLALRRNRFALNQIAAIAGRRRPAAAPALSAVEVERLARWSGIICRGTCLTDAFVHRMLAARHGLALPVTIGVSREGDALRAHAWAGDDGSAGTFAPLWTDPPVNSRR